MLSIIKLNKDEIDFLINTIGIENIRKQFQKNPRGLQRITPLRAKSLSADQIRTLVHNNLSEDFIYGFFQSNTEDIVRQIDERVSKKEKDITDKNKAIIIVLAESLFKDNVPIYYKLKEKTINDDYLKLVSLIVKSPKLVKDLSSEKDDNDLSDQIEKLTKQLEEKETLIESGNERMKHLQKETDQKVTDISKQLDEANTAILSLQSELNTLKAAEQIPEEDIDDGYTYHSLCEVFTDYNGKVWLKRLADIEKNRIIPFECDEFKPRLFGNRNKLYHKNGPVSSGTIGIWAWNATENWNDPSTDYIVTSFSYDILAIQIIEIQGIHNTVDIINSIKNGIKIAASSTNFLFAMKNSENGYKGVLCSTKNSVIENGILKLKNECYSIDEYSFNEDDTIELDGKMFYKYLKLKGIPKTIKLYDPIKIVTDIVLKRASWNVIKQKGVSKNTWKICRDYITELPQDDLYKEICDACKCSESEAKQYVTLLIENAETYINNDNVENDIIANIIPKHPELIEKCKELIYHDWEAENEERIAAANEKLLTLEKDISDKKNEYDSVKKEHDQLSSELRTISDEIADNKKLASDVEEQIKKKIDDARKNAAEFISQMAFVAPINSKASILPKSYYSSGSHLGSEGIEEYDDMNSLHALISEELQNAGVSSKFRDSLAAYLYSAYLTHTPVLLAGPCGKSIANAFSAAINARLAGVLNCSNSYERNALTEVMDSDDKVIIIENPFSSEWVYSIMELINMQDKFFILVTPFIEDLSIEPKGLLNYVLPIFTELFVDSEPTNAFVGSIPSKDYMPTLGKNGSNRINSQLLSKMRISSLAVKKMCSVISQAASIYEISEGTDLVYVLLPCAYITGKEELLLEAIHNQKNVLSKAAPEYIKLVENYLGEYDE
ncbi:hypothetical protein [Ruminococcus sp. XPD3002]|uniref:hypothetical protein n=1 Tax=Ruminococcus sp. XPD3002 TaxID=1452269 RepID=UPI000912BAC2|nr:hypothetical protein SAMN04487832_10527 [Ruminococcus flavefaciens]